MEDVEEDEWENWLDEAKKPIEKQTSQNKSFGCGGAIKRTFEPNKNNNKKSKTKITQKRLDSQRILYVSVYVSEGKSNFLSWRMLA